MTSSSQLVVYQPRLPSNLTRTTSASSLISHRLFSQQTGTAIATELLYRILFDIINRLLVSLQRLASRGMDSASSFIERKLHERHERLQDAKQRAAEGLRIADEVGKLALREGFMTCPVTGQELRTARGPPSPPFWVQGVLDGIEEGRMHKEDFWTNQW